MKLSFEIQIEVQGDWMQTRSRAGRRLCRGLARLKHLLEGHGDRKRLREGGLSSVGDWEPVVFKI